MASAKRPPNHLTSPDHKLTAMQAKRLASLAGVNAKEVEGLTIAQASERLRWIDPHLFWFRELCGKVVKKDPVTGVDYPVPFATVNVQETDCDVITYFPLGSPWGWHLPIFCRRETIATVKTDACGNFCVWVPRFEIEWILRWREERICFPVIFNRPILKDLIPQLIPIKIPGPPDPGPLHSLTSLQPSMLEAIAGKSAGRLAEKVARVRASQTLGSANLLNDGLLNQRVFDTNMQPPLPHEFRQALTGKGRIVAAEGASSHAGVRAAVALKLGIDPEAETLLKLDLTRFVGPFWRCIDILVPEWQLIFEVPDISFEVTQDIDGDGTEEVIYDDHFGVNWNVFPTPDITLVASPIARESRVCGVPDVPCGDTPAILFAGLMPLDNPAYFDESAGYVLRVNRPSVDGDRGPLPTDVRQPAQTPFCESVQLYGCVNVEVGDVVAQYYRVMQSVDGGVSFTAITGLSWNIYTFPGGVPVTISPDSNGWYEVLANPDDFHPARLVLDWPTPVLGEFTLKLQVGDGGKNVIGELPTVPIQVDNTAPTPLFQTLAWKFVGEPDTALRSLLGEPCPLIRRGSVPQDVEVSFEVNVSANHLRDASISVAGCGGGAFVLQAMPTPRTFHWYTTALDDSVLLHGRYRLAASALDGCYTFGCDAISRAMNPSGADGGNHVPPDWFEDPIYIRTDPSISVAVVSEN